MTGATGSSVAESLNAGPLAAVLAAGTNQIDQDQEVVFTLYRRVVLPADGFVFWVKADQLRSSALYNSSPLNSTAFNQPPVVAVPAPTVTAKGSLHHTTTNRQDADESFSVNTLVFTSLTPVNDLNEIAPDSLYLATTSDGQRYAFSSRNMWYQQAALYHYRGEAVYPSLGSQIIDNPAQLDGRLVVSNSLPIWLTLNQMFPVYPSYLVPDNIRPPYASVHIGEEDTSPLQSGAWHDATGTRWQLVKDRVRVTTYGIRNDEVLDWLDSVIEYSLSHTDTLGIMNSPIPRDGKRGQTEISAIAQLKLITFEASYYQARVREVSRQLIKQAFITVVEAPPVAA